MKKRKKLPIILVTALVVLLGGAFVFNVISHQSAGDEAYAAEPGKDPSQATGNDAQQISAQDMKSNVAAKMKLASTSKPAAPKRKHGMIIDDDAPSNATGPMILSDDNKNSAAMKKPTRRPNDAHGVGQWYRSGSSASGQ